MSQLSNIFTAKWTLRGWPKRAQPNPRSPGNRTWGALVVGCAVSSFGQLQGYQGCLTAHLWQGCRVLSPGAKQGWGGEAPRPEEQGKLQLPVLPSPWQGCEVKPSWRRHRKCSQIAFFGVLLLLESGDLAVGEGSRVFPGCCSLGVVSPRSVRGPGTAVPWGTPGRWQHEPGEG